MVGFVRAFGIQQKTVRVWKQSCKLPGLSLTVNIGLQEKSHSFKVNFQSNGRKKEEKVKITYYCNE